MVLIRSVFIYWRVKRVPHHHVCGNPLRHLFIPALLNTIPRYQQSFGVFIPKFGCQMIGYDNLCIFNKIHTLSINQTTSKHGHDSITLRVHLLEIQLKTSAPRARDPCLTKTNYQVLLTSFKHMKSIQDLPH